MKSVCGQVVVRALPGWHSVEADAVAVLVAAEERLLLALEPPAATPAQPLTLAMLQVRPRTILLQNSLALPPQSLSSCALAKTVTARRGSLCPPDLSHLEPALMHSV